MYRMLAFVELVHGEVSAEKIRDDPAEFHPRRLSLAHGTRKTREEIYHNIPCAP